ncbi:MAG TPA: aldehyde dehydrogenase family protein, partial [Pelagibacterales bacterium]|nr:aldehyde dehydrogenase family protein [Pelagibacterales bacterium]
AQAYAILANDGRKVPMSLLRVDGLPEGVFNVLPGDGTTGKALCMHNDVDCVAFTGSGEVGKKILGYSGQSNMKRVQLECGGKSPNIIFSDCENIDTIVKTSANAIFGNQGEVCSAASRLIVQDSIKDEFIEKVVNESKNMMPGDPWDPKSFMGAIVDKTQLDKIDGYVQEGQKEGAKVAIGGKVMLKNTGGYYYEPTVFDNVKNNMKIAQEEIFGPVLSSITFKSTEEALKIANDTSYGLAAAVWTRDINKAHLMAKGIKAGSIFVNNYDEADLTVPAGGYKQSGIGRDNSYHALDTYLQVKSTWIKLSDK